MHRTQVVSYRNHSSPHTFYWPFYSYIFFILILDVLVYAGLTIYQLPQVLLPIFPASYCLGVPIGTLLFLVSVDSVFYSSPSPSLLACSSREKVELRKQACLKDISDGRRVFLKFDRGLLSVWS